MWFAVENMHCVTGHKNEDSVKRNVKLVGDNQRKLYSAVFYQCLVDHTPHIVRPIHGSSPLLFFAEGSSISLSSDVNISPSDKKKMKICADGNKNFVTITLE